MTATAPSSSSIAASSSSSTHVPAAATANCSLQTRTVSHWTKSTPEEGIQVIFNSAEVLRSQERGVQMETHPPTSERPRQWELSLRLVHPPPPPPPLSTSPTGAHLPLRSSHLPLDRHYPEPTFPPAGSTVRLDSMALPTIPPSSSLRSPTLLVLTMDQVHRRDIGSGTDISLGDIARTGKTQCDAYRTLYIYSPKLKRDICVHSIRRELWPQNVVFDGADVMENQGQEYHFQIWLAGSSPRQPDARTNVKLNQCQQLLWAMRKDTTTTNVEIVIKSFTPARAYGWDEYGRSSANCKESGTHSKLLHNNLTQHTFNHSDERRGSSPPKKFMFRAHKCVLESSAYFDRMLNGEFREAQADDKGLYTIRLSDDMFDVEIMDHLLDYLYTREPIMVDAPACVSGASLSSSGSRFDQQQHLDPISVFSDRRSSFKPEVRHVVSANVGLNFETVITETRYPAGLCRHRSHHQCVLPATGLTLWHWGALYRAALHLEDKELQTMALQQIQAHLDPETTLEQVLKWGHQHEEVKAVMLEYLIKKRREVFGDEQRNRLRPYLWAEYEEQVEALVEITSQIARQ
ncbi:hypothetical protein BGZ98_005046 [Dissophora globulifera]|nr:hypothetical protein BGZ98_005046 [Dissophora globulifera]